MKKLVLCIVLALALCLAGMPPYRGGTARAAVNYDREAAAAYAAAHWNDGVGICDDFAKACLAAGGITITAGKVTYVYRELLNYGTSYPVQFRNGVCYASDNAGYMEKGDILCWYCATCAQPGARYEERPWPHMAVINRIDENEIVRFSQHNGAQYDVKLTNTFYHEVDGVTHSSSNITCYVVHIDTPPSQVPSGYYDFGQIISRRIFFDRAPNAKGSFVQVENTALHPDNVHALSRKNKCMEDWRMERQSDGSYIIRSYLNLNLVLEAENAGKTAGTNIRVAAYSGADHQKWYIYGQSSSFMLVPKHAQDMALTTSSDEFASGANICLQPIVSGKTTQCLLFQSVGYSPIERIEAHTTDVTLEVGDSFRLRASLFPVSGGATVEENRYLLKFACNYDNTGIVRVYGSDADRICANKVGTTQVRMYSVYNDKIAAYVNVTVVEPTDEDRSYLPSSLTAIEERAFEGSNLPCVVIPDACTKIENFAFNRCQALKRVYLPGELSDIDTLAFFDCPNIVICAPAGSPAIEYAYGHGFKWHETTE